MMWINIKQESLYKFTTERHFLFTSNLERAESEKHISSQDYHASICVSQHVVRCFD